MNEFDQFAKHELKAKHYIRYADDFVFLSRDKEWLESLVPMIAEFLDAKLALTLHPDKVYIKSFVSGVDFLGWVHFPGNCVLRTATKRRMMRRLKNSRHEEKVVQSYIGLLSHGNAQMLAHAVKQLTGPAPSRFNGSRYI